MEKTLVQKIAEKLVTMELDTIKYYLWQLCCNPVEFLETFGYTTPINPLELQKEIVAKACEAIEGFSFGIDDGNKYSHGINLKIKNPIIRDTIIEHCELISENPENLRICINKMCTRPENFGYSTRRRQAFQMLEFSESEQKYLEREIDTYCIGQLLKKIQEEKYPDYVPEKTHFQAYENNFEKTSGEKSSDSKLDSKALIENATLVTAFLTLFEQIKERGLDPSKVGEKRGAVRKLYASLECL